MSRKVWFLLLALALLCPRFLHAEDDGPPISITSPDSGTTFAYASVKDHALVWNKNNGTLTARVTFTDAAQSSGQPNDDTHYFRLPGVSFDAAKGIFYAVSSKGEVIPVAHYQSVLFLKTIETMPNANVRVIHPRGICTVILEAVSPNDPSMHSAPSNPDGSRKVDVNKIFQ